MLCHRRPLSAAAAAALPSTREDWRAVRRRPRGCRSPTRRGPRAVRRPGARSGAARFRRPRRARRRTSPAESPASLGARVWADGVAQAGAAPRGASAHKARLRPRAPLARARGAASAKGGGDERVRIVSCSPVSPSARPRQAPTPAVRGSVADLPADGHPLAAAKQSGASAATCAHPSVPHETNEVALGGKAKVAQQCL